MRKIPPFAAPLAALALLALAGCASDSTRDDSGSRSGSGSSGSNTSDGYSGARPVDESSSAGDAGGGGAAAAGMPTQRVVHFDLDSAELKPEAQSTVSAWAAYLSANPGAKLRLEGHCDERGTREYNIGLGERRGNAVLQALTAQGVAAKQLSVASFGEERPVALGHDEAAWGQNRRVELAQ